MIVPLSESDTSLHILQIYYLLFVCIALFWDYLDGKFSGIGSLLGK